MKLNFLLFVLSFLLLVSCNQDEGLGGSSYLEGYVYEVIHRDDNFSFTTDTIPAIKKDVFIVYGDDDYTGDDVKTDLNGKYRFDYLRKGNYLVYAYSEYASGEKEAISQKVNIKGKSGKPEPIYIHSGKAYGTAIIKGKIYATYTHNSDRVIDEGWGTGIRVYIGNAGEEGYFDDLHAANGIFYFQKLLPGEYRIAVETQDPVTEKVSLITTTVTITETGIIYEIPKTFEVNKSV
jgi:hypothetical protein